MFGKNRTQQIAPARDVSNRTASGKKADVEISWQVRPRGLYNECELVLTFRFLLNGDSVSRKSAAKPPRISHG